jgi:periplasmic protein TonB
MHQHADILDQQESLGGPFVQSVLLHAAIAGALILASISYQHSRQVWGSASTSAGNAVAINAVTSIPLPSRAGQINPLANNTETQVPQAPKLEPKKQVKIPDENAIPLKSKLAKKQPRPEASHTYQPKPIPENQLLSHVGQAAVSPMFEKPGSGGAGVGTNSAFGNQFGAYADLVVQRVTEKWQTGGMAGLRLPMAVITFDILRDGSVKNAKIAQSSGNTTLDYSALRAVMDVGQLPPLPANYSGSSTNVELRFQLQR